MFRILITCFTLLISISAQAEWFLRGTHNNWAADQMQDVGSNTMLASSVNFSSAGQIKFDRFGDWSENYGQGGLNGNDISVSAGTWDIKFFTDTKNWDIQPSSNGTTQYHFRGTANNWVEGTLLTAVAGTTNQVETCQDFSTDTNPRFKIDPDGAWGDAFPASDYLVSNSWVKIVVNTDTDSIATVSENLPANCADGVVDSDNDGVQDSLDLCPNTPAGASVDANGCEISSASQYHLRGTPNGWAEGTLLTAVAGTNDYDICINFTGGDANGGPRFKIDKNGGWGADAFPATDYIVSTGYAHIVVDSSNDTIKSVDDGLGIDCSASVADFRSRMIYFMFVDRFANGDPSNDFGNNGSGTSTVTSAGDETEWKKYWGGDIQGIIDHLDYLQQMGVGAIWVTPLVDNIDDTGAAGAYHGYWGRDFYEVDEHLGNWTLFDQLDVAAEARGIKIVLDIALNHSNQNDQYEFGKLLKEGAWLTDYSADDGTYYHHNGGIADCGNSSCAGEWDDPWSYRNKDLFALSDFNHGASTNSTADQYLIDAAIKWMAHGVDAFRIDAIKHIEPSFVDRFSSAVRAINPDVYIFGEWYGAGANDSDSLSFLNANHGSELLDFNLRDNIENALAGNTSMIDLSNHIASRDGAMNGADDWQTIFLDNHDATRMSVYLQTSQLTNRGNGKGFSQSLMQSRMDLGATLVMTLPGIPTIYYGTEQYSTWFTANNEGSMGHDPYNRETMPSFATTSSIFVILSSLADLRKNSAAIQNGSYNQRWVNSDILVYERISGSDVVLVAVNRGGATTISVSNLALANGSYNSLTSSDVVSVSSGVASLSLGANEAIVLH